MVTSKRWLWVLFLAAGIAARNSDAQIDPEKRELIQLGFNTPLEGHAPLSAYAFYYYNKPSFLDHSNLTLRLAVAPVYADSEVGFIGLLGPHTDLGIGIAGGGFADSYYEIRQGKWFREESFTGHGGGASVNIYHLFNPDQQIPLNGVLRGEGHFSSYERDDETAAAFTLPRSHPSFNVRSGLRWGGQEPLLSPALAMELSAWYEGQFRADSGDYGFNGDRHLNSASHLFWGRALLAYTFANSNNFLVSVTGGSSSKADRFSAYRIGGVLPLASEFPLTLPGYFYQELSATRFVLFNGTCTIPLDKRKRWAVTAVGTAAFLDYLPGLEQPNHWNSGLGGGITYRSHSGAWLIHAGYGYGFNAIRDHGKGAQNIGVLVQFNLERAKSSFYNPGDNSIFTRGYEGLLRSLN